MMVVCPICKLIGTAKKTNHGTALVEHRGFLTGEVLVFYWCENCSNLFAEKKIID